MPPIRRFEYDPAEDCSTLSHLRDAILDQLVHNSHRLSLRRESPRKRSPAVRRLTTGTASIARAAAGSVGMRKRQSVKALEMGI